MSRQKQQHVLKPRAGHCTAGPETLSTTAEYKEGGGSNRPCWRREVGGGPTRPLTVTKMFLSKARDWVRHDGSLKAIVSIQRTRFALVGQRFTQEAEDPT